jgi:putative glutamine amidotransferase
MTDSAPKPLIGVPANVTLHVAVRSPQHAVAEKYMQSIIDGSGGVPMVIPAFGDPQQFDTLLDAMDGLLLTGGAANIEPHHYGGAPFPDDEVIDQARDRTVLPLIRACIDRGIPVFGICRGIQEMNVALGGTLHYRVHQLPGRLDHRMRRDIEDMEVRYEPRHSITLTDGGYLSSLVDDETVMVNTLHGQAIDRPAPGMEIEALAEDETIEAVRLRGAKSFTVGVQWHAEWKIHEHELSRRLFGEFGTAARASALRRGKNKVA